MVGRQRLEQSIAVQPIRMVEREPSVSLSHRRPFLSSLGKGSVRRVQSLVLRQAYVVEIDPTIGMWRPASGGGRQRILGQESVPAILAGQGPQGHGQWRLREQGAIVGRGIDRRGTALGAKLHAREPQVGGKAKKVPAAERIRRTAPDVLAIEPGKACVVDTEHKAFDAQGLEHLRDQSAMVTVGSHYDRPWAGIGMAATSPKFPWSLPPKQAASVLTTLSYRHRRRPCSSTQCPNVRPNPSELLVRRWSSPSEGL